jgi:hypothetical protein
LAKANERKIMAPSEFRKLLNLEDGNGLYGRRYKQDAQKIMAIVV